MDIFSLVDHNVHKFQVQAANKKVDLSLRVQACPCGLFASTTTSSCKETHLISPSTSPVVVVGDDMRLGQVVCNLLSNAIKFTSPGGSIAVWMEHRSPPDCCTPLQVSTEGDSARRSPPSSIMHCNHRPSVGTVMIGVKDSGVGMTSDQLTLLFTEGIQFDANKLQAGGGSGLGLCISKGIVDRHNGDIWAVSDGPSLGSTFCIELPLYGASSHGVSKNIDDCGSTLPLSETDVGEEQTTQNSSMSSKQCPVHNGNQEPPKESFSTLTKMGSSSNKIIPNIPKPSPSDGHHVLVVEDVQSSQKMLVRLLERSGHTCETAWNGQDAFDKVQESLTARVDAEEGLTICRAFDTILMDFEMPILNGPDATKRIREELGYDGLIVGVTGNVLEEDVNHFISMGADAVVPKPIGMVALNKMWQQERHVEPSSLPSSSQSRRLNHSRAMLVRHSSTLSGESTKDKGKAPA